MESGGEFVHHAALEAGVVGKDGAMVTAEVDQGLGAGQGWIAAGKVKKPVVLEGVACIEDVEAELERNLLIRSRAFPDWNGEHGGLEIEEICGEAVRCEIGCRALGIKKGFAGD